MVGRMIMEEKGKDITTEMGHRNARSEEWRRGRYEGRVNKQRGGYTKTI